MVRAMVQSGPRKLEMREFPRPKIGPDDGLVRIEACGICGSDVEQYRGHMWQEGRSPSIPGHEPLGVIEEVGERAAARWGVEVGDRVAGRPLDAAVAGIGIALGVLALYAALAFELEDQRRQTVLPVFRRGSGMDAITGDLYEQVARAANEAGVRKQL